MSVASDTLQLLQSQRILNLSMLAEDEILANPAPVAQQ